MQPLPGLQQFCCWPKNTGAPPFCGTLLLSPSLLSLSRWCSVELLPGAGPAAAAAALQREEGIGRWSKCSPWAHTTPSPSSSERPQIPECSSGSQHHVWTELRALPRAPATELPLLFPWKKAKSLFPTSHSFLPEDAETLGSGFALGLPLVLSQHPGSPAGGFPLKKSSRRSFCSPSALPYPPNRSCLGANSQKEALEEPQIPAVSPQGPANPGLTLPASFSFPSHSISQLRASCPRGGLGQERGMPTPDLDTLAQPK